MTSCEKIGAHRIGCSDCAKEPLLAEIERLKQELAIERQMRRVAREQCTEAEHRAVDLAALLTVAPDIINSRFPAEVVATEDTCGGNPRLHGTRLCVHDIVSQVRLHNGDVLTWWREDYPYLTLQQVLAALGYYAAHQAEIDQILVDRKAEYDALPSIGSKRT